MSQPKGKRLALLVGAGVVVVLLAVIALFREDIVSWYLLWKEFERLPDNEQGYPEYRHRATGIVFVRVPGGTFLMGSTEEEFRDSVEELVADLGEQRRNLATRCFSGEIPRHQVRLSPFLIGKYELTQTQWHRVMNQNPSSFKEEELPVENILWKDAKEFCRRTGFRLPTEAQWEYACRAGSLGKFAGPLDEMAWYKDNSGESTHPVGQKHHNGFGLFDVHGNVAEWCEDSLDRSFYGTPEAVGPDPVCRNTTGEQIIRGGSWLLPARFCRASFRFSLEDEKNYAVGFRPACYPIP